MNVAEHIYHNHDDLIVGRVDCTKYSQVCDEFEVRSYPKIAFLNKNLHVTYKGDRSAKSMIEFAERLKGPDILTLGNCNELKALKDRLGLLMLYALNGQDDTNSSKLYESYKSLAASNKDKYWFYQTKSRDCPELKKEGIYLFKKNLNKSFIFDEKFDESEGKTSQIESIKVWLERNSFPVFGQMNSANIDHIINLEKDKDLIVAILDEYQPVRKFSQSSKEFHKVFESFVINYVQKNHDNELYKFVWTSDLDLIRSILVGQVLVPNLMILRPNYTYHLVLTDAKESNDNDKLPEKLSNKNLLKLLDLNRSNKLEFYGGNSYLISLTRQIYGQYSVFTNMFKANPLLVSILLGLPSLIMLFVIYTTCFGNRTDENDFEKDSDYFGSEDDEADEEEEDEHFEQQENQERRRLLRDQSANHDHVKQD